ncbi:glycosyltransferase [Devosia sp. MC1541]|uniref:glycosyltransferase n=1 Tax=Devosia sp. MC1541 TaxID=2725264 RepID=UPI00145C88A3|nr:glycosyltransferase [Devosia sp. MC1541]
MPKDPAVAVLLATHNGSEWVEEQVDSILGSAGVRVHIFVSDDASTDRTLEILNDKYSGHITVLPQRHFGSAGKNFLRLLEDAGWDEFDYVSFCDQDDIWKPEKLAKAVAVLSGGKYAAYSSDVMAFFPDGRTKYIRKSKPQRKFDHLFESAGPGNTFVFPQSSAVYIRQFIKSLPHGALNNIRMHDWFIYCLMRSTGQAWFIDEYASLLYRQHASNVLGASIGLGALYRRFPVFSDGWYMTQLMAMQKNLRLEHPALDFLRRPSWGALLKLLPETRELRRRPHEAFLLWIGFLAILLGPKRGAS